MIETLESPYIHAATAENFKSLVLENSNLGPVLVNFWSRKAGPCLRLYPILDKMVHHYAGRVLLVNIDTEGDLVTPREYGISSVPTLKLFRNGQVVETWHGYQSEEDLAKVLDIYVARDSDQILAQAIHLYTEGNLAEAYEMIAEAIVSDPINPRLPLAMCKLLKHEERYEEALKLIETLPDDVRNNREIDQLHDLLNFYLDIDPATDLDTMITQVKSSPDDIEARQLLTANYVLHQRYEDALNELVAIMDTDPGYNDNYAQKAMLKIFNILGNEHALIAKFRSNLKRYTH
jgi:putative thioredoxin